MQVPQGHTAPSTALVASVGDAGLYKCLVPLCILAYTAEARFTTTQRRVSGQIPIAPHFEHKLPKGTLKQLCACFNRMALLTDARDAAFRRSCLALYAFILEIKKADQVLLDDLKTKPEVLVVRFLSVASKELQKTQGELTQALNAQGVQFVELLLSFLASNKSAAPLVAQLEQFKETLAATFSEQPVALGVRLEKALEIKDMDQALYVAELLTVSKQQMETDINAQRTKLSPSAVSAVYAGLAARTKAGNHPLYTSSDFTTLQEWTDWCTAESNHILALAETTETTETIEILPEDVRASYYSLLVRCLAHDANESVILVAKSRKILQAAATYWRVGPETQCALLLAAVGGSLQKGTPLERVQDTFNLVDHISKGVPVDKWPGCDCRIAKAAMETLRDTIVHQMAAILLHILDQPQKLGPYLQLMETLPELSKQHLRTLRTALETCAQNNYDYYIDMIPRDESLSVLQVAEMGEQLVLNAKRLQKKYPAPLFEIHIAKVISACQIKLFGTDLPPMLEFLVANANAKDEFFTLEEVVAIHSTVKELSAIYNQVAVNESFDVHIEPLLFPHLMDWAQFSANLAHSWVQGALDQDTFVPIDPDGGAMYSTSVKDLFASFSASVDIVDGLKWSYQYHVAKVLTRLVQGFSEALNIWSHRLRVLFFQTHNFEPKAFLTRQERWLAMAKEAVATGPPPAPEPFHFSSEVCVILNDIEAAHMLLFKMEETMNSDAIAHRVEVEEKKQRTEKDQAFLYTIDIRHAANIQASDAYVTVMDEGARCKIGRTTTSYGKDRHTWNQKFEFVSSARTTNIKLMVWDELPSSNHDLIGVARLKLGPMVFDNKEYGTILKSLELEAPTKTDVSSAGLLLVQVSMDLEREDIRFYFGHVLRLLKQTQDDMVGFIVEQFSAYIRSFISLVTIRSMQKNSLSDTLSSWLRKNEPNRPLTTEQVEDYLQPLFDYLNSNFATLATSLSQALCTKVMMQTWHVVLDTIETLILPPRELGTQKQQLSTTEIGIVFTWLTCMRDFFHNGGAGPSLELLQSDIYQKIMTIPVYYDLSVAQLRQECEKLTKSGLRASTQTRELLQRKGTIMAHRNRKTIQAEEETYRSTQRAAPEVHDVIVRLLRLRNDHEFVDKYLEYRRRLELKKVTDKALLLS